MVLWSGRCQPRFQGDWLQALWTATGAMDLRPVFNWMSLVSLCLTQVQAALPAGQQPNAKSTRPAGKQKAAAQELTLRALADQIGFRIGATIAPPVFDQPQHQAVLGREYNSAESVLQFRMVQPQEGRFNFTRMDRE